MLLLVLLAGAVDGDAHNDEKTDQKKAINYQYSFFCPSPRLPCFSLRAAAAAAGLVKVTTVFWWQANTTGAEGLLLCTVVTTTSGR